MVKVKCSNCGAVLNIKEVPGLMEKSVLCPVCGEKRPFSAYKKLAESSQDDDDTICGSYKDGVGNEDETYVNLKDKEDNTVLNCRAYLVDKQTKKSYALREGVNYIGRKANSTPAKVNVMIETSDMGFSRAHLGLEVVQVAGGVRKYKIFNDDNKNLTYVNGNIMEKEDKIFLKNNDIIKSSTVELQFLLK